ncbi:hypothetical protein V2J09_007711 [Rumex salicifolius]
MTITKISCAVLLVMVLVLVNNGVMAREVAVDCRQIQAALEPCTSYLTFGGEPNKFCCDELLKLKASLNTTADKQAACACIKAAAARFPTTIDANAAQLPEKCHAPIGFPVSRNVDCSSVN